MRLTSPLRLFETLKSLNQIYAKIQDVTVYDKYNKNCFCHTYKYIGIIFSAVRFRERIWNLDILFDNTGRSTVV